MKSRPPQSALTRSTKGRSGRPEPGPFDPTPTLDRPGGHSAAKKKSRQKYRRPQNRGLSFLNGLTSAPIRRPARFAAVEPKRHHNAPGPLLACALALANAPAMSFPAESAIEPKRSENMTVTWRRSALLMIWQELRRRPRPLPARRTFSMVYCCLPCARLCLAASM